MTRDVVCHHPALAALLREDYSRAQFDEIVALLDGWGTLELPVQSNGLVRAVADGGRNELSGYHRVWVRDAVQVAYCLWRTGEASIAVRGLETLLDLHARNSARFEAVVRDPSLAGDPMQRPHIRFDADTLDEVDERWPHAQNDALGYVLWLASEMWGAGDWKPSPAQMEVLANYVRFFRAVRYWQDRDSGHWEETRAVHASSIGVVVAGLESLLRAPDFAWPTDCSATEVEGLARRGREVLNRTLPAETPGEREADAALLFLVEPLRILEPAAAARVVERVTSKLLGPYGIKRYEGDSYWCADYRELLDPSQYSSDYSLSTQKRDALLKPGTEAQWCIFDPVLSIWYGQSFAETGLPEDRRRQVWHLNRSLGQVTGPGEWCSPGLCSEAYFLASSEEGVYRPNDQTPLVWAQANLRRALAAFRDTLN